MEFVVRHGSGDEAELIGIIVKGGFAKIQFRLSRMLSSSIVGQ